MPSTLDLRCWGGLSAMVAGGLFTVAALLQGHLGGATLLYAGYVGVVPLLGSLLLLGGLVGLHASRASVYGWLGDRGSVRREVRSLGFYHV